MPYTLEGFDTYTFPAPELREEFKLGRVHTGVEFAVKETEDVTEFHRCFFLHLKRLTPTLKERLTK